MLSKTALVRARCAVERLYVDSATITTEEDVVDAKTGIVTTQQIASAAVSCRLSYKRLADTTGDGIPVAVQSITLYLAPEIDVPPGADIDVEHGGRTLRFKSAGAPAFYTSHQEIPLELRGVHNG